MTIEQNLKNLLGEYSFQLCVLQQQNADQAKTIETLQEQLKETNEK